MFLQWDLAAVITRAIILNTLCFSLVLLPFIPLTKVSPTDLFETNPLLERLPKPLRDSILNFLQSLLSERTPRIHQRPQFLRDIATINTITRYHFHNCVFLNQLALFGGRGGHMRSQRSSEARVA